MARNPTAPISSPRMTLAEKQSAINRLKSRIEECKAVNTAGIKSGEDVHALAQKIQSTLANIYGEGTQTYQRLIGASYIDSTVYSIYDTPVGEIREGVERGRNRAIGILQAEVDALLEDIEASASKVSAHPGPTAAIVAPKALVPTKKEIFIVHGRDDAAKIEVARLVERAGLAATILHEQPNGGRTIIQKFEDHGGAAGFAIVIMTPDDVGGLTDKDLQPRARQNVIGEMFWFAGRLGRERVCALKKGALEVPTDFAGVGYVDMDSSGAWKHELLRELDHAGYKDLDWPKALA